MLQDWGCVFRVSELRFFRGPGLPQNGALAKICCDSASSSASEYDDWPLEPDSTLTHSF